MPNHTGGLPIRFQHEIRNTKGKKEREIREGKEREGERPSKAIKGLIKRGGKGREGERESE